MLKQFNINQIGLKMSEFTKKKCVQIVPEAILQCSSTAIYKGLG
jgi:hypothetical protein